MVALPPLKVPRLPEKLPVTLPDPVGWMRNQPSVTDSGAASRAKLGVTAPAALRADTVAEKLDPARIGPAETPVTDSDCGAAMKLSLPVIVRPVSSAVAVPV